MSVIRHITMERLQEENDRDIGGGINAYLAPRENLNAISEDASLLSSSYVGSIPSPGMKPGANRLLV